MNLIDKDDLLDSLRWAAETTEAITGKNVVTDAVRTVIQRVEEQEVVDAAPVAHARWDMHNYGAECSACQYRFYISTCHPAITPSPPGWGFCPNCGAKMDGGVADG